MKMTTFSYNEGKGLCDVNPFYVRQQASAASSRRRPDSHDRREYSRNCHLGLNRFLRTNHDRRDAARFL